MGQVASNLSLKESGAKVRGLTLRCEAVGEAVGQLVGPAFVHGGGRLTLDVCDVSSTSESAGVYAEWKAELVMRDCQVHD